MMKVKLAAGMLVLVGLAGSSEMFAGRVVKRQVSQEKRIHQGIRSGELTRGEVRVLQHEQQVIERHKDRARSDGVLTPKEKGLLEHEQDNASRHIYRLKNNERDRN